LRHLVFSLSIIIAALKVASTTSCPRSSAAVSHRSPKWQNEPKFNFKQSQVFFLVIRAGLEIP